MQKLVIAFTAFSAFGLSGCLGLDSDLECGLAGAATGAVVADATGASPVTGALIGGAAGVAANDVSTLCR